MPKDFGRNCDWVKFSAAFQIWGLWISRTRFSWGGFEIYDLDGIQNSEGNHIFHFIHGILRMSDQSVGMHSRNLEIHGDISPKNLFHATILTTYITVTPVTASVPDCRDSSSSIWWPVTLVAFWRSTDYRPWRLTWFTWTLTPGIQQILFGNHHCFWIHCWDLWASEGEILKLSSKSSKLTWLLVLLVIITTINLIWVFP